MILRKVSQTKVSKRTYLTYGSQLLNFQSQVIKETKTKNTSKETSAGFSYGVFSNLGMVNGINKKLSDTATKSTDIVLSYLNSAYFQVNKIFPNEIFSLEEIDFKNLKTKYSEMNYQFRYQTESDITGYVDVTIDYDGRKLELKKLSVLNKDKEEIYIELPNYFSLMD
eukprot:gene3975-7231_t